MDVGPGDEVILLVGTHPSVGTQIMRRAAPRRCLRKRPRMSASNRKLCADLPTSAKSRFKLSSSQAAQAEGLPVMSVLCERAYAKTGEIKKKASKLSLGTALYGGPKICSLFKVAGTHKGRNKMGVRTAPWKNGNGKSGTFFACVRTCRDRCRSFDWLRSRHVVLEDLS